MGLRRLLKHILPTSSKHDWSVELSKLEKNSLLGITSAGKKDGGGAQVHAVMSAILFSRATGIPYFHTPFKSVEHGGDPALFACRWEKSFNLGAGSPGLPQGIPIIPGDVFSKGYRGPPAIVEQQHFHAFADENPDFYRGIVDEFRARLTLPPRSYSSPTIAVHARRGDVVGAPAHAERLTGNAVIARRIESVLRDHPGHSVRVFSQGNASDFQPLPGICEFELDSDIFATLSGLIHADCLIMAKSSLSYVAGLLSKGAVYYEPFWHKPLSSWQEVS
ncbi:hypothetical protein [Mesorhizobium sp.]|uniref:hypothetical protein n=1 Tax=Mesorhizobium sp. TaxID=1871066 RepID=UPI003BA9013E